MLKFGFEVESPIFLAIGLSMLKFGFIGELENVGQESA